MAPILGALFAILVGLLSVPSLISWQNQAKNNVNAASIAQQARQILQASGQYIQANAATLQATATTSTPVTVSVAQLQAAGLLPEAFKPTNLYNQTWQLQILQPTAGNLQGLAITTGGDAISDLQAMQVAKLTGYEGGFFPKNDSGRYPGGASNAYGASWGPLAATGYTSQAGHIALLVNFSSGQLTDNRLYRNAVPGQPQLNTMTTPLIMASTQTAESACTIKGAIAADSTGGLLVCQDYKWKSPGSAYWKDPVATFAALPASGNNVGDVRLVTGLSRAFTWNGASWVGIAVDQNGNLTIPGTATINALDGNLQINAIANEGTGCSGERRIAASSSTGALLQCIGGLWQRYVRASGDTWTGRMSSVHNDWALTAYDAGWGANAAPQSAVGSLYVNDIFLRSKGMWVSQITGLQGPQGPTGPQGPAGSSVTSLYGLYSVLPQGQTTCPPSTPYYVGMLTEEGPDTTMYRRVLCVK